MPIDDLVHRTPSLDGLPQRSPSLDGLATGSLCGEHTPPDSRRPVFYLNSPEEASHPEAKPQ